MSPGACLAAAASDAGGRRSRHAWTRAFDGPTGRLWLKTYPAPDGTRARRAWRMGAALRASGFAAPEGVLVGTRAGAGVLVTRDTGGRPLVDAVAASADRHAKRRLLDVVGAAVARLHAAGFVHGDLVPTNVHVHDGELVFLDHDRTRRGALLAWWGARRNLVQLGRFVVPGVGATDRARVLRAYAAGRGLSRRARHRLARWTIAKTVHRRCAIDAIPPELAARVGFPTLMRSGGPFDPGGGGS